MKKKVVTIGGGTGSYTLLLGLKEYPFDIKAIVSMADDGGSTGRLRDELGVLPPGDVRQCLVALSGEDKILRKLFNYRFEKGQLRGHSFGNIMLSALEKMCGSFSNGLEAVMKILDIKGEVIPVTENNVELFIRLKNGEILRGESKINHSFHIEKTGLGKIFLKPKALANHKAIKAIKEADTIIIGPGNYYCSLIPNLLVDGIVKAIRDSRAKLIYVANLVNKKGHTQGFFLEDYVNSINDLLGGRRIGYVIYNNSRPSRGLISKYKKRGETLLEIKDRQSKKDFFLTEDNFLGKQSRQSSNFDVVASSRALIRHDSLKLGKALANIIKER